MKKTIFFIIAALIIYSSDAKTLSVGQEGSYDYSTITAAAGEAVPGDTIQVFTGVYTDSERIENLQGTADDWIIIKAAEGSEVLYRGGSHAWHFSNVAYLHIIGFGFEAQTSNGVNIDDGGSFDSPSHHIIIENCKWFSMDAAGNNDELKLSGLDDFEVKNCMFNNGSDGGSLVDMVGCHRGRFINNEFNNAGSNAIQAKGGSSDILIAYNIFRDCGQRSINIGGSTGLQFFRPQGANYEAKNISVAVNIFAGSTAPIAFVGAVNCSVYNNTIVRPEKWAIRILQETTGAGFLPCGNNAFYNNIVLIANEAASPTLNIGANTDPESFTFSNNLWFNEGDEAWSGPNLPVAETNGIIGTDPMLKDAYMLDVDLQPNSPAIGAGVETDDGMRDFAGNLFNNPPSIGAFEGNPLQTGILSNDAEAREINIYPNPAADIINIKLNMNAAGRYNIEIIDLYGQSIANKRIISTAENGEFTSVNINNLANGLYLLKITTGTKYYSKRFIIKR